MADLSSPTGRALEEAIERILQVMVGLAEPVEILMRAKRLA